MKTYRTLLSAILFLLILLTVSCNSYKDAQQRQNLMMPKKSELQRNKGKYHEVKKKKTYKPAKSKKRKYKKRR